MASRFGVSFFSQRFNHLQKREFQYESDDYETLMGKYPKTKGAIDWWCNMTVDKGGQFVIGKAPYMKEFVMENHPDFKISNKCCTYAKKMVFSTFAKGHDYDLSCTGIRKSEGGIRANAYKNCFSSNEGTNTFRPIFWFRDQDKEEYCEHYGVIHSRCYTEYGLKRTGCVGCPFNKKFEEELEITKQYEPKLYKAAIGVFGKSYDYTRRYLEFREEMKKNKHNDT